MSSRVIGKRVRPLVDEDVEEDGDLSLEAIKDEEVALVDGVFEGGMMLILGLLDGLEVEALVDAMEGVEFDDK
uniref:Uncharacterized protein n=1 Tax=Tanacetum cinerariifolium TaxID=118510 RepID=A0A6L2LKS6_TANCI|nr:hypothetical protein [Tanacetum cinerariifolium]